MFQPLLCSVLGLLLTTDGEPGPKNSLPPIKIEQQVRVGQIFVVGNGRTRHNVILRQLNFGAGNLIDRADLFDAQLRLKRLNLFKGQPEVVIIDEKGTDPYKDILVTVEEKKRLDGFGFACLLWLEGVMAGTCCQELLYEIEATQGVNPVSFTLLLVFETALDVVGDLITPEVWEKYFYPL